MQASQHWLVLAQDLANRINNELILTDNIDTAVFVKPTCGDEITPCEPNETSTFNEAFRDLLITSLYNYGIPTQNKRDEAAIDVLYKVQVVRHNTDRLRSLQPGLLTTLSTAVIVLRNAPTNVMLLGTGVGADIANTSFASSGHYEVIITTSMIENDKYLFRASDIYYINDKDFFQYQDLHSTTTPITLKSKNSLPTTTLPQNMPPADSSAITAQPEDDLTSDAEKKGI